MESFQTIKTAEKQNKLKCHELPVAEKVLLSVQASGKVNELLSGIETGPDDLKSLM